MLVVLNNFYKKTNNNEVHRAFSKGQADAQNVTTRPSRDTLYYQQYGIDVRARQLNNYICRQNTADVMYTFSEVINYFCTITSS